MKTKTKKRSGETEMPWHQDFRNPDTLPDVKVVRTSFFINVGAVLLLMAGLVFLGLQELHRSSLRFEIEGLEAKISENRSRNEEVLRLQRDFQKEEREIDAAIEHLTGSFELSAFLVALARSLPEEMRFSSIRFHNRKGRDIGVKELRINGDIAATPDDAATILTGYVDSFQIDPFLEEKVREVVPTSLVAAPEEKTMSFGIHVILRDPEDVEEEETK